MPAPQMNWVGSAPSDVVLKAGETGQRWGQLMASSIQEGMQLYAQKQITAQRQKEVDAQTEQYRIGLIANDISNKLTKAGEGNELLVFRENPDAFRELYNFYAKGNADLADTMFKSTESQFMRAASPSAIEKLGMIQVSEEGQPSATPTVAPSPTATTPQAQLQPPEQSAAQVAVQPEAAPTPTAAPPSTGSPIEGNQVLMDRLRAKAKELYPNEASKIDSLDNAGMLKEYPKTLNKLITGMDATALSEILASGTGGAVQKATGTESMGSSIKMDFSKTGLNPAIAGSVQDTMSRLDEYLKNNASEFDMTPKEEAATKVAGKFIGKVLSDSPMTKAWIAAGGREEALQQAADALAKRLTEDPNAAEYWKGKNVFSAKETSEMLAFAKEDRLGQDMVNDYNLGQDRIKAAQFQTAIKGYQAMASLLVTSEKTKAAVDNAHSKMTAEQIKADVEYRKLAHAALYKLQDAVQKWKDDFAKLKPKATNEQRNSELNRAFAEDAALRSAWMLASDAAAKVNGGDAKDVALQFKAAYMLDLPFDLGVGEKAPAGEVTLPGTSLNPTSGPTAAPKPSAAAAKPVTAPKPAKPAGSINVDSYVNSLLGGQ